jgi:hypothetical protein
MQARAINISGNVIQKIPTTDGLPADGLLIGDASGNIYYLDGATNYDEIADGDRVKCKGWRLPQPYAYTAVSGAAKNVPWLTCDIKEAVIYEK